MICFHINQGTDDAQYLLAAERLASFVRDYGFALLNPTQYEGITLAAGEAWETTLRLVAYDGALEAARVEGWLPDSFQTVISPRRYSTARPAMSTRSPRNVQ